MKKIFSVGKILLIAFVFIIGISNVCFADVYLDPIEKYGPATASIMKLVEILILDLLLISLVCMLIGKAYEIDKLLNTSKKVSEILLYCFLLVLGIYFLAVSILEADGSFYWLYSDYMTIGEKIAMILPLPCLILSLYFRLSKKHKKIVLSHVLLIMLSLIYILIQILLYNNLI